MDGDHWQSLQLSLPNTSNRDVVVHGNDLVLGTYGRGIWVLDDISPLRQMMTGTTSEPVHLFAPGEAGSRAPQCRQRHAVSARGAARAESAGRRNHLLLTGDEPRERSRSTCSTPRGQSCAT